MDLTLLIALVGAAAWLPQIFLWAYKWLVKPQLRFAPENISEIGYTSFGLILNQTFAISTSKKDALIEKITLSVKHESGATHDFYWDYLDEKGAEMITTTGERAEFRKNQKAIALKISTLGLVEKKIYFRDISFQQNLQPLMSTFIDKALYLDKTEGDNAKEKASKTKEFLDVLDCIKKSFDWREGKYTVSLYAYETSLRKPHIERYEFALSRSQVELLDKNIEITQESLKDLVLYIARDPNERPKRFWHWINPSFYRANKR